MRMKKDAAAATAAAVVEAVATVAAAEGWTEGERAGGGERGNEARKRKEKKGRRERERGRRRVLEIRLLHRAAGWEKPKALVTFLYVNLGRCTFRPGTIWWGAQIGGMHLVGASAADSAFRCSLRSGRGGL